jgi:hypothetical protein
MKTKTQRATDVNEHDFAQLDAWARGLRLEEGRPLSRRDRLEHERAKRVGRGRPRKAPSEKAGRYLVSMDPALHEAAVKFSKTTKKSLSGLIAEALAQRIAFKARATPRK